MQVGGIPHLDWAECQAFIELFTQSVHFDVTYLWRNPIVTQDRARPNGYDAKLRFDGLSVANAQLHDGEDHPLSTHHLVDADIARLSRELSGDEKIIFPIRNRFSIVSIASSAEQRREALSQVIQLLTKVEPIPVGDLSLAALDDFLKTDWFIDWIKKSLLIEESSVSLSYLIYDSFPGFFGNQHAPVKGPCPAELIAKKRALYRFLSLAREYPVDFPGTTHYLDENLRMKGLIRIASSVNGFKNLHRCKPKLGRRFSVF